MKEFMDRIETQLEMLDERVIIIGSILVTLLLGYLDYLSGLEFSFSLFYLLPVSITAWFVSRNTGLLISVLSAVIWFVSNSLAGQVYSNPAFGFWNSLVRLGFFSIITFLITNLKQSLSQQRELSYTDFVTGVNNSRAFYAHALLELFRAQRYKRPFTIAYLDLDNFKLINDRLGHSTGDALLKTVAETMTNRLRRTDIIARLGGDEFAVFLPETAEEPAALALNELHNSLLKSMEVNRWEVTFSIGVMTFYQIPSSLDDAIRQVDALMYTVKSSGKNNIAFDTVGQSPE